MNKVVDGKRKKRVVLLMAGVCVLLTMFAVMFFTGREKDKDIIKVGFITPGNRQEMGWNRVHMESVERICANLGVELKFIENVKEFNGACPKAIDELSKEDTDIIFLNSYGYTEEAKDVINNCSDISFYANQSGASGPNLSSYFVRMYQARYLAGIMAGMATESNEIGYVAAMSNTEVNRGINAFTLGVKSVNSGAVVNVIWTGDWDNEVQERKAVNKLIDMGVDVISYHQNQTYVAQEADKHGVYSIGYHQSVEGLSNRHLTAVVSNWDVVYEEIIRAHKQGKSNDLGNYWLGIDKGAVMLSSYSTAVTQEMKDAVDSAIVHMKNGKDVFSGNIYDTEGIKRCGANEMISDDMLLSDMNWLVKGVYVYEGELQ